MSEFQTLPVIPLRDAVLFPGAPTLVRIGRPGTLKAIRAAADREDSRIFVVAQKDEREDARIDDLRSIGTVARVIQISSRGEAIQALLEGVHRGVAVRYADADEGGFTATVRELEDLPPPDEKDATFLALARELRDKAVLAGEKFGLPEEIVQVMVSTVESPGKLADTVCNSLDLSFSEKQRLLEELSVEQRIRQVLVHLLKHIEIAEAQKDIQSQVKKSLGDRQREAVLREQMEAIRKELGEGADDEAELDDLRAKVKALELPESARKEAERQLRRLERGGAQSMDAQVARSWLETFVELPWGVTKELDIDLARAEAILEEDHFGLADVKDRVLEFLAVRKLQQRAEAAEPAAPSEAPTNTGEALANDPEKVRRRAPILLFEGPPGVGKTSIAKSIARALGRSYARIALGGVRDEADIRGHRRTYVGAMPGRLIEALREAGSMNPVIVLDEVDKLSAGMQGNPSSALLEVLDPAQNDSFVDHYLGLPFDLSQVLFIATANVLEAIPAPLRDRMEVVSFRGYTEAEKLEIARRFIVPRQRVANALDEGAWEVADAALQEVITYYTREAGVRQLERVVGKLARKVARKVAAREDAPAVEVAAKDVRELLGRPKIKPERAALADQVGVATGMYYTPVGGDIMFVEVSLTPGKGRLTLTGQLGEVMKESAQAAWSYARAHGQSWVLSVEELDRDVHVHVPAGAIPKDGPSAGVTMASALVSALTGIPVRRDVAMSGEVTLTGRVLPVGGIKEKVLGAVRAGISRILLPQENAADLEDLPEEVRSRLEVTFAESLSEVLSVTLARDPSTASGAFELDPSAAHGTRSCRRRSGSHPAGGSGIRAAQDEL